MTVFKAFLKIVKSCKSIIIMYTVILIVFGTLNFQTEDISKNFTISKPDVYIVNNDEDVGIVQDFVKYIERNSNIKDIENNKEALKDALFYRDVNYIIYIPKGFRESFLNGEKRKIEVESTGDYNSNIAQILVENYMKYLEIYNELGFSEDEIIRKINSTLEVVSDVEVTSKIDASSVNKMVSFYNFANYSMFAALIYVVCLILSSFKSRNVNNRTIISSMSYKKFNRILFMSNSLFTFVFWLFYVILSFILLGKEMFSIYGLILAINFLFLGVCALSIAFLIGNLVRNKESINGIVTVVSLGSSFLCGVFVPVEFMPDSVLKLAHILPSYWYVKTNTYIQTLEIFDFQSILPILINIFVMIGFVCLFVGINNFVSYKKRKMG